MKIKWNRWNALFAVVVVFLLFGMFYFAEKHYISPEREIYESSSRILDEQNVLLARANQQAQTEEEWLNDSTALQVHLPLREDADYFVQEINELLTSDTIEIERLIKDESRSGIVSETTSLNQMYYLMELNFSSLADFQLFIENVIQADRFIEVIELEYQQVDTSNWEGFLLLRTYYQENHLGQ